LYSNGSRISSWLPLQNKITVFQIYKSITSTKAATLNAFADINQPQVTAELGTSKYQAFEISIMQT
jgi:hypothetical protein